VSIVSIKLVDMHKVDRYNAGTVKFDKLRIFGC